MEKVKPRRDAKRRGKTEKAVKPFNQTEKSLLNE